MSSYPLPAPPPPASFTTNPYLQAWGVLKPNVTLAPRRNPNLGEEDGGVLAAGRFLTRLSLLVYAHGRVLGWEPAGRVGSQWDCTGSFKTFNLCKPVLVFLSAAV